ncbi:hypothetical protein BH23VER1_BH23VER1_00200 [soil metagenome]
MRIASIRRFPLPLFVIGVAASFVVVEFPPLTLSYGLTADGMKRAEFYPLSSFPMYSRFSGNPVVVYVADAEGEPLPALTGFGVRTSVLKKYYDGELRRLKRETGVLLSEMTPEQKRPAGDATLRHLVDNLASSSAARAGEGLTLHEVTIGFGEGEHGIATSTVKVGEILP